MNRKKTRTMGRVALLSTCASETALRDAGLLDELPAIADKTGVAYGSCAGGIPATAEFGLLEVRNSVESLTATTYVKMMAHTCAANISIHFGLRGRIIPTSSACTSGSQAVGFAYEAVKHGYQTLMLAGGAEELSTANAAVFDIMYATSTKNDAPKATPRPFDVDRDGLVTGEGAATLVLEELEHARARGARIYGEVVGYGTNANGAHITQPNASTMTRAMQLALENAGIEPEAIGYINAHATATEIGDIVESEATHAVFGPRVAISSLKSYTGHTLGASGALEAIVSLLMLNADWYHPTLNLEHVDPRCAELDYLCGGGRQMQNELVMSNNFAFGGVNTSLIFKRI